MHASVATLLAASFASTSPRFATAMAPDPPPSPFLPETIVNAFDHTNVQENVMRPLQVHRARRRRRQHCFFVNSNLYSLPRDEPVVSRNQLIISHPIHTLHLDRTSADAHRVDSLSSNLPFLPLIRRHISNDGNQMFFSAKIQILGMGCRGAQVVYWSDCRH